MPQKRGKKNSNTGVLVLLLLACAIGGTLLLQTNDPLQATISPNTAVITEGQTATYTCTVTGGTPPYQFNWYLDNQMQQEPRSSYTVGTELTAGTHSVQCVVHDTSATASTTVATLFITEDTAPFTTYSLTISVSAFGGGTTDPPPDTYSYAAGTQVTVTAQNEADYILHHWLLDSTIYLQDNPVHITMNEDHTLQAVFKGSLGTPENTTDTDGTTNGNGSDDNGGDEGPAPFGLEWVTSAVIMVIVVLAVVAYAKVKGLKK